MNTTAPRPTENQAIGRAMKAEPRRLSVQQILLDRAVARENLDRFGDYLLGGRLQRALGVKAAG